MTFFDWITVIAASVVAIIVGLRLLWFAVYLILEFARVDE